MVIIFWCRSRRSAVGNLGCEARAVPPSRQKRLFEDAREDVKVVTFMIGLNPGDLAQMIALKFVTDCSL